MTIEELKRNNWRDELGNYWNLPNSEWIVYSKKDINPRQRNFILPLWFIGKYEKSDKLIIGLSNLIKELNKYNRSIEEYYSRFFLNIHKVPKCRNKGCNNKVRLRDGKVSHGLSEFCCRSCHISDMNRTSWKDPNYIMNSLEFRRSKSNEMKNNLSIWNYNPEFQAKSKRGRIRSNESIYVFYLARTKSGYLKFGVAQDGSTKWRLHIQKEWNKDEYVSFHILFKMNNKSMSDFEYNLKREFEFREYLNWNEFNKLKIELKKLYRSYSV